MNCVELGLATGDSRKGLGSGYGSGGGYSGYRAVHLTIHNSPSHGHVVFNFSSSHSLEKENVTDDKLEIWKERDSNKLGPGISESWVLNVGPPAVVSLVSGYRLCFR